MGGQNVKDRSPWRVVLQDDHIAADQHIVTHVNLVEDLIAGTQSNRLSGSGP